MQVVLVMFRPEGERRSFSITRELTVVGRREDCDFRIPLGEISRKHCRLIKDGDQLRIEDLGSSNGTYHNGQRVQEAILSPGDTLQIGSVVFVVQIDGTPADDELQPMTAGSAAASEGAASDEHDSIGAVPLHDDSTAAAAEATTVDSGGDGEFDPMSVLESGDSAVAQESMVIDLEESSHGETV